MSQRTQPLVSVVMPVHGPAPFLTEAVESVLGQSHSELELVVVVDRADAQVTARVHSYSYDERLVVLRSVRPGVSAARNTALDAVRGEFVVWQDSDDVAAPCRMERLLAELTAEIDYAHSDLALIDGTGRAIGLAATAHVPVGAYLPMLLRFGNPLLYPSMMLRATAIGEQRFCEQLSIGEDMDFARRVVAGRRGVHVPEPLLYYRRHGANTTATLSAEMVAPSTARMLAEEPLERLVPEVSTAYAGADADAVGRAVVALRLALRGCAGEVVEQLTAATSLPVSEDARSLVDAVLHLVSDEPRQALERLRSARTTITTLVLSGEAHLLCGRPVEAAEVFRAALEAAPDSFDARTGLTVASRLATDPSKTSIFRSAA